MARAGQEGHETNGIQVSAVPPPAPPPTKTPRVQPPHAATQAAARAYFDPKVRVRVTGSGHAKGMPVRSGCKQAKQTARSTVMVNA
eukprot:364243-Chlamydomonas_euryale.AAC.6